MISDCLLVKASNDFFRSAIVKEDDLEAGLPTKIHCLSFIYVILELDVLPKINQLRALSKYLEEMM